MIVSGPYLDPRECYRSKPFTVVVVKLSPRRVETHRFGQGVRGAGVRRREAGCVMARETVLPTLDEHGDEHHPAWALIGASRVQSSAPGATLFDSDIRHQHYVVVTLRRATRKRKLNHDWLHPSSRQPLVEVAMSEAQWASFVSSMNVGNGVPCTLRTAEGDWNVPGVPYEPRLRESMAEVHTATDKALEDIRAAFAKVKDKPNKGNLRDLEIALQNATPNVAFAAESLSKHAENVVQKARADIEAMVVAKAQQLGLEPGDLGVQAQLVAPDDDAPAGAERR
jgi:hypothetical protein